MSDPKLTDCDDKGVTPEMIQAGLRELFQYERGADDGAEYIREIYVAMEEARLLGGGKETRRAG